MLRAGRGAGLGRLPPGLLLRLALHARNFVKLFWRLFCDHRVPIWAKAVPVAAALYILAPIDILPEFLVPIVGYADDVLVGYLALRLFVRLCPRHVVDEHVRRIDAGA